VGFEISIRGRILGSSVASARLPVWLALRQGDSLYWGVPPMQIDGPDWFDYETVVAREPWGVVGSGPAAPELAAGEPIQLGFMNAASCAGTTSGACTEVVEVTGAVDDWTVTIHRR